MAKSTVYPYGTNGELPSSIGLVNDLTTGGVDKALTAEQGKVIGEEIYGVDGYVVIDLSQIEQQDCSLGSNNWYTAGQQKHQAIPVTEGKKIILRNTTAGTGTGWYVFCTQSYAPPYKNNQAIPAISGSPKRNGLAFGEEIELVVPISAAFLIITTVDGANNTVSWEVEAQGGQATAGIKADVDSLMDGVFGVPHEEAANWDGWNLSTTTPYRVFNICAITAVAGGSVRVALTSYTTYKIGVVIQNGTAWMSSVISDTGWKTADIDKAILPSEAGYNIRVSIGRVDNSSISLSEFESAIKELSFTYIAGENGLKQSVESISDSLANPPKRIPMQVLGGTSYVGKKLDVVEHSYSYTILGTVAANGQARQGCAVYGDYLFQCFNTNNAIAVFKLSTGQNIQTISLTSNTNNHANSASFGSEKYSAEDVFPCLYISSEGEKKAYVYRITGTEGAFSVTLVQTLSFAGVSYYYPNLHVDAPNMRGIVVGYKVNSWKSEAGNKMLCCCFDLPSPTAGDASLEEPYGEFSFPFIYATQGAFGRYGKLYHSFGNTSQGLQIGGIIVVDYIMKTVETFVDLKGAGDFEPEGIGIWDGGIVVSAANGVVRKLTF